MKDVKLSVKFSGLQYPYLKMMCARERVKLQDFVSNAILREMEIKEEEYLLKKAEENEIKSEGKKMYSHEEVWETLCT